VFWSTTAPHRTTQPSRRLAVLTYSSGHVEQSTSSLGKTNSSFSWPGIKRGSGRLLLLLLLLLLPR